MSQNKINAEFFITHDPQKGIVCSILYLGEMIKELNDTLKIKNEAQVNTGFYIGDNKI